jgi:restriction system protein
MLPWWAGVLLAGLAYVVLHHVAGQPSAATVQPGHVGAMVAQTLWRTLASIGKYVLPILCLAGAAMSAWRRSERKQLIGNVARSEAADALDGMSWQQFERLVGEGFRLQGYRVVETGGGGADGGVDLVLNKGRREVPRSMQTVARVPSGRRRRTRAVRRDGSQGRSRWFRRDVGTLHG